MEKTIEQNEVELQQLVGRLSEIDDQIRAANQALQDKKSFLGDSVLEGTDLQTLLKDIKELNGNLDNLKSIREAANSKAKIVRGAILEVRKGEALKRLNVLQGDYDVTLGEVIDSLVSLWETSRKLMVVYGEAVRLSRQYKLPLTIRYGDFSSGLGMQQYADKVLSLIEKLLPDRFQASGVMNREGRNQLSKGAADR